MQGKITKIGIWHNLMSVYWVSLQNNKTVFIDKETLYDLVKSKKMLLTNAQRMIGKCGFQIDKSVPRTFVEPILYRLVYTVSGYCYTSNTGEVEGNIVNNILKDGSLCIDVKAFTPKQAYLKGNHLLAKTDFGDIQSANTTLHHIEDVNKNTYALNNIQGYIIKDIGGN